MNDEAKKANKAISELFLGFPKKKAIPCKIKGVTLKRERGLYFADPFKMHKDKKVPRCPAPQVFGRYNNYSA